MRRGARPKRALRGIAAVALALGVVGCPRFPDELCDGPGCDPAPDAAGGAEDARDDDDAYAIHVAPQGDDAGDGTRARPVRTLARALALADPANAVVHACAGDYEERIDVAAAARRVSIRGGFRCDGAS